MDAKRNGDSWRWQAVPHGNGPSISVIEPAKHNDGSTTGIVTRKPRLPFGFGVRDPSRIRPGWEGNPS